MIFEPEKEIKNNRYFSYKKGGVALSFTLSTDKKDEMQDFLACLLSAQADVRKSLIELRNHEHTI